MIIAVVDDNLAEPRVGWLEQRSALHPRHGRQCHEDSMVFPARISHYASTKDCSRAVVGNIVYDHGSGSTLLTMMLAASREDQVFLSPTVYSQSHRLRHRSAKAIPNVQTAVCFKHKLSKTSIAWLLKVYCGKAAIASALRSVSSLCRFCSST